MKNRPTISIHNRSISQQAFAAHPIMLLFMLLFFIPAAVFPQTRLGKTSTDVNTKYTTVGNVSMTVTNFGTIGSRNYSWQSQPSCEYPRGSKINHIYNGGLWVGAHMKTANPNDSRNDQFLVSTGTSDQVSSARGNTRGYEFNSSGTDSIIELSSLSNDRPITSSYSPLAVSHQDFICDYTDDSTHVPTTGDSILDHSPMNIKVHQESYCWNFPFADFFVILRYQIINASAVDTLDSVYVGMWDNAVVRNWNYVRPGTTGYYLYTAQAYDDTARMAYSFDFSGVPGGPPADSYVGLKLLGATPFPNGVTNVKNLTDHTFYNIWIYTNSGGEPAYFSPTLDYDGSNPYNSRYSRMTQSMPKALVATFRTAPQNATYLLTTGPFRRLNPHDTVEVDFAVVCARKFGKDPANKDTPLQRKNLYANANWAQHCYQGEDVNGNDSLDTGEDIARRDSVSPSEMGLRYEPDHVITRYLLPAPPRKPKVHAVVENNRLAIYWDKWSAEESIDPISDRKDFEGYRIYRSNPGDDFLNHSDFIVSAPLVADFDRADDHVGYNTGFSAIQLAAAQYFAGDTTAYWYRYPPPGDTTALLNGWQYVYSISAYDQGDSVNNVPILESTRATFRLIPGTMPTSAHNAAIGVYPNPYYVNAVWDGAGERQRKIYFYNLPAHCQIVVYTLAGDVVTVIDHDAATYTGQGIQWFTDYGDAATTAQFAGGEHAWDLITRNDQAIATGLYLFTVKDNDTGDIKRGKFLIIK